jgi:hypothetical protein
MSFKSFYYKKNEKGGTLAESKNRIAVFTFGRSMPPLSQESGGKLISTHRLPVILSLCKRFIHLLIK